VPGRTNDFQELITLLVQILREDRATPSAMAMSTVPGVGKREVDIRVKAEVNGVPVNIDFEASHSKSRPKSVEWVERMRGKHEHLDTFQLILVSNTGFSKGAKALAKHHRIKLVTPDDVTPGFVGAIVNNLTNLGVGIVTFKAEKVTFQLDPPPISGDLPVEVLLDTAAASIGIYGPDATLLCSVDELAALWVREKLDLSAVNIQELESAPEKRFNLAEPLPVSINGGPIFVMGGDDPEPATTLRQIMRFDIAGTFDLTGTDMRLTHSNFDGTNFSNGVAVLDELQFHWAVTEGEGGMRIGTRVAPVNDPLNAQTYRSIDGTTRMVRVSEGNSHTREEARQELGQTMRGGARSTRR
jgi:hypothetical protein